MRIEGEAVDKNLATIMKSVSTSLESASKFVSSDVDTAGTNLELKPPVSMKDCKYVFDNASFVAKCCRILAKDILLNDIILEFEGKDLTSLNEQLEDYKTELYFTAIDYYYAGIGAFEYIVTPTGFMIKQIPIHTTKIVQVELNGVKSYLLKQQIQTEINYFKILGETYPKGFSTYNNKSVGDCCVVGGDNFYLFFSEPLWVQESDKIFTEIAIGSKNLKQISNGNISAGILNINLEPEIKPPVQLDSNGNPIQTETREDVIKEELTESNGGVSVIFTEGTRNLAMDYVKIENDNYGYLMELQSKAEQATLNCYGIPLVRLMINTEKESMNSNKTQSIWEIYNLDLKVESQKWITTIREFINKIYGFKPTVNIELPEFTDKRETEIKIIIDEWNNGLINLRQAVTALAQFDSNIDLNDYNFELNKDLWDYRKIDGYYDLLNEVDQLELDKITDTINQLN